MSDMIIIHHTVFLCPACAQAYDSVEELDMHAYSHDPEPQFEFVSAPNGDIMEFMVDVTTRAFVFVRSWTVAESQVATAVTADPVQYPVAILLAAPATLADQPMLAAQTTPEAPVAVQAPVPAQATFARQCQWVDCNALFTDDDQLFNHIDQQHIGILYAGPVVRMCSWNGCNAGPTRDRAEMRRHLLNHAPGARPFSCNGGSACGERFGSRRQRITHHRRCAHEQARRPTHQ